MSTWIYSFSPHCKEFNFMTSFYNFQSFFNTYSVACFLGLPHIPSINSIPPNPKNKNIINHIDSSSSRGNLIVSGSGGN